MELNKEVVFAADKFYIFALKYEAIIILKLFLPYGAKFFLGTSIANGWGSYSKKKSGHLETTPHD